MTYDCFLFFNELDLLEIRLNILYSHVDYFVIAEATKTHQGSAKPLFFHDNRDRFKPFMERIIHVVCDDVPTNCSWAAEKHQRDKIMSGLSACCEDDIILVSDVDEIPSPDAVEIAKAAKVQVGFLQQLYYYYLNVENVGFSHWTGTRSSPFGLLKSPQKLREINPDMGIEKGGWHWSYLGGPEAISYKIQSFAHGENNIKDFTDTRNIANRVANLKDIFNRRQIYERVEIDHKFPEFIIKNMSHYKHLIL